MPYALKRRNATITFEGTDYDGLEMRCKFDVGMNVYLDYQRVIASKDVAEIASTIRDFGDKWLIEWNLEEDGAPVPATGEGMLTIPIPDATTIVAKWLGEMATPSVPLVQRSLDGSTLEADSTTTETASESQSS